MHRIRLEALWCHRDVEWCHQDDPLTQPPTQPQVVPTQPLAPPPPPPTYSIARPHCNPTPFSFTANKHTPPVGVWHTVMITLCDPSATPALASGVSHHIESNVECNHFHQATCVHHQTKGTAEPPAALPQQQLACQACRNKLGDSSQPYEGQDHPPVAPGVDGADVGLDSTATYKAEQQQGRAANTEWFTSEWMRSCSRCRPAELVSGVQLGVLLQPAG